ncbi:YncE family protein [Verminephrobacter aporrectodeae]|uniref:YncE family protein n=1 Tax=Verminephrobacter aporrectodeae subsp. tuberculatae TaxID=1110392 RepID=A0ABT3KXQ6_9BURK|nr:hypothetical protein [Verminephrobacter aporrectodeae]MCW5221848.1 YncE family protein [Verminephrobacter aporrectodeae subsp. tuberculatae]MCW5258158.1 YncE family protein [Verminephrobacter aporrectodeae subsp. tuberculatae]MCW5291139.1 YncE family protein [Verminephrobacter aporrectodeae subsp. tuberculatae]MCW5322699.1 YncE family protein [Verminephrobacter aporrectodeae subsp. tuberculatae]MCW8163649.1 YncE family protein [Verminephrobacter aporrectodeae subsp. tuberculatae]
MTRDTLMLVEKSSHCLSYYDLDSGARLTSIALPDFPHEFVVDSRQAYAYIGHYGVETAGHTGVGGTHVFQIDIARRKHVRSIDVAPFNRLHGMQMDAQDRLYALSEERAQLVVLEHPETDNAPRRVVGTGGIKSHLFALTRDGQTAYALNLLSHTVTRIRPHDPTCAPVACAPGEKPEGCALSADEKTLYVSCRWSNTLCAIDCTSMQIKYQVPSRDDATRLYLHRDGRLLVTNYGARSLSVVDPGSLRELAHVPMGARAIALSFHPTRPLAFVSQDDDRLGYFNMQTLRFERWIATQRKPDVSYVLAPARN